MKDYLPPLKSLRFFVVAGQTLSFKQAAAQLNVTQAAVSQQIRQLEQHLQCKLFERNPRQVVLTEQGRRLLPFIQQGFEQIQQGVQALMGDPRPAVLRISALHSFTSIWLLPRLPLFQRQYPQLMVQLAPSNELVDFEQQGIDLGLRMGSGNYAGLKEKKLLNEQLILVASPKLVADIDVTDPQQVFSLPWMEDTTPGIGQVVAKCCRQFGIDKQSLTPVMQTDNALPLLENAVYGQGVTLINRSFAAEHLQAGRLVQLLDFVDDSAFGLYLVAPKNQFDWQKVHWFEQWITEQLALCFGDW